MIKILLIDNDKLYADSLVDTANMFSFEIEHFQGLEEGLSELESRIFEFSGIILDGRGWLSEDKPTEVDKHVHMAVERIKDLRKQNVFIPYVINTGYFERIYEQITEAESELIFDKTKGAEPMLMKLQALIEDFPQHKIRFKYPEAFESFGGKYLPISSQTKMIDLLTWVEDGTLNQNYFNSIRDLIEEMLKRANAIDSIKFLPNSLLKPAQSGRPNLKASELYLTGRQVDLGKMGCGTGIIQTVPIFSSHIGWLFSSVTSNSQILSHNYNSGFSKYAFQSSVFALIEILIWFKGYVDKNYAQIN